MITATSLYTLGWLPTNPAEFDAKLRYCAAGSALLLYQDGVLLVGQSRFESCLERFKVYVLNADAEARGLGLKPNDKAVLIDYTDFVQLTLQHKNVQAW